MSKFISMSTHTTFPSTTDYWVSFEVPDIGSQFELHSPWWVSGYTDDSVIICAAIRAANEYGVMDAIDGAFSEGASWDPRFCDEMTGQEPWSDRFPQADWMAWNDFGTCSCELEGCDGAVRPVVKAVKPIEAGRGTREEELRGLCSLFMSDDTPGQKILDPETDEIVRDFLDSQARSHGYDNWVVAYHEIGA